MRRKSDRVFVLVALIWLVVVGVLVRLIIDERGRVVVEYPERGMPVIEISLNGVSLEEINRGLKEVKYGGNELALYNEGEVYEYEDVEVKGRGNGTWVVDLDKKPYQIKFDHRVELLGLGKARKWYLLANAMDATNLRTEAAFYLGEMLGMEYVYEGRYVELYVNEEYRGLYYLTRAVEISKDLVDLRDPMGVLVELDNIYGWAEVSYETGNGDKLVVRDAVAEDNQVVAMEEFLRDYNEFEVAVAEGEGGGVSGRRVRTVM